jgi:hypothetical protein
VTTTSTAGEQADTADHHGSHLDLLDPTGDITGFAPPSALDAIIVPTARTPDSLRKAIPLAQYHRCTLVALCSRDASAAKSIEYARDAGVTVLAADINDWPRNLVPSFQTTSLLRGTRFERLTDTSLKRNLGLVLSVIAGWERIVFLDDDITVPDPADLSKAVALLDKYAAVGLHVDGCPDNSVVCHAYRESGGPQETFIGGGALAVGAESFDSFFPNVYNEDWFFLLTETALRRLAIAGSVKQAEYDPFTDPRRAVAEEFGDSLAEGLFWLLDQRSSLTDANSRHWQERLNGRRKFINKVLSMTARSPTLTQDKKRRMTLALRAALKQNRHITADLCVDYVAAWRRDRTTWQEHIESCRSSFPTGRLDKALAEMGLMHHYHAAS